MKKLLSVLSVVALLYCLFLAIDAFRGEPSHEGVASSVLPSPAERSRPLAEADKPAFSPQAVIKKHLRVKAKSGKREEVQAAAESVAKGEEKAFVEKLSGARALPPLPKKDAWEVHRLPSDSAQCPRDRDCTPKGRDGVLMLGSAFAANQPAARWQGSWNVGSAAAQTPLMYLK